MPSCVAALLGVASAGLFFLPFICGWCDDVEHSCRRCNHVVARKKHDEATVEVVSPPKRSQRRSTQMEKREVPAMQRRGDEGKGKGKGKGETGKEAVDTNEEVQESRTQVSMEKDEAGTEAVRMSVERKKSATRQGRESSEDENRTPPT